MTEEGNEFVSDDIEEFLNESFMVLDEIEEFRENHDKSRQKVSEQTATNQQSDLVKQSTTENVEEQSVVEAEEESNVEESHPYLCLIENYELTKEQKTITNIGPTKSLSETKLQIIQSKSDLVKLLATLKTTKEIAIDFQCCTQDFDSVISLIEISTRQTDYILDARKLKNDLLLLTEIFINPKIVKILYKSKSILAYFQQYLHLFVVNMFDVERAAQTLKIPHTSLGTILKEEFSFNRDGKLNLIFKPDFRTRPIPDHLKDYCRGGTHYLIYLYHNYKNQLLTKDENLFKDVMIECREDSKIVYRNYQEVPLHSLQDDLKNRQKCEIDVLKKLVNWRGTLARKKNLNPNLILSKTGILTIASTLPVFKPTIFAISGSHHVKNNAHKIINMVHTSKIKFKIQDREPKRDQYINFLLNELEVKEEDIPNFKRRFNELTEKKTKESKPEEQKTKPKPPNTISSPSINYKKKNPSYQNHQARRRARFQKVQNISQSSPPKVVIPTNVPSNVFQSDGFGNQPFNETLLNSENVFNRCLSVLKNVPGNFGTHQNHHNNYDNSLSDIDYKINTLERKVSQYQDRSYQHSDNKRRRRY